MIEIHCWDYSGCLGLASTSGIRTLKQLSTCYQPFETMPYARSFVDNLCWRLKSFGAPKVPSLNSASRIQVGCYLESIIPLPFELFLCSLPSKVLIFAVLLTIWTSIPGEIPWQDLLGKGWSESIRINLSMLLRTSIPLYVWILAINHDECPSD